MDELKLLQKIKDYLKNNNKVAYPLEYIKNNDMKTIRLAVAEGEDKTFIKDIEFYFGVYIETEVHPKSVITNYIQEDQEIKIRTVQGSDKTFRIQKKLRSHLRLMNPLKDLLDKRIKKSEEKKIAPQAKVTSKKSEKTEVMYEEGTKNIKLRVIKGVDEGTLYSLSREPLILGRQNQANPQDIKLHDNSISKAHAQIEVIEGSIYIVDLSSTNGTYVNDTLITKQKLTVGDRIFLGQTELEVILDTSQDNDSDTVYIKADVKREAK